MGVGSWGRRQRQFGLLGRGQAHVYCPDIRRKLARGLRRETAGETAPGRVGAIDFARPTCFSNSARRLPRRERSGPPDDRRDETAEKSPRRDVSRRESLSAPRLRFLPRRGVEERPDPGARGTNRQNKDLLKCQALGLLWSGPLAMSGAKCSPFSRSAAFLFPRSSRSPRRARSARKFRSATRR